MAAKRPEVRISLDQISGDWATIRDICAWGGVSEGTAREWCRSGPLRDDVVRFNKAIRVRKTALARLRDGE